jgi:hypothetical protein
VNDFPPFSLLLQFLSERVVFKAGIGIALRRQTLRKWVRPEFQYQSGRVWVERFVTNFGIDSARVCA